MVWDVALDATWSWNTVWDVAFDVAWSCNRACNVALDVAGVGLETKLAKVPDAP